MRQGWISRTVLASHPRRARRGRGCAWRRRRTRSQRARSERAGSLLLVVVMPASLDPRGDGRADPLPPGARLHRGLRPRARAPAPGSSGRENQVLSFAASGSGAMESAVANLVGPGEPVVVAACGKFGERWFELCQAYGGEIRVPRGRVGRGDRPRRPGPGDRRDEAAPGAVFTTHSESSTGVVNDIRALARRRPRPRRGDLRRCDLGPRRGRAPTGRVGGGRGRRRVAEGADVPAGPRLRLGERAGDALAAEHAGAPLLLRLGADRPGARRRSRRTARSRRR